jgi:16S rRNA (uracil1498-N3)-methyltransferase
MRLSRLFTDQELAPGTEVPLDAAAAHYLLRVLRLKTGDRLVLFNGDGADYAAQVTATEKRQVRVAVDSRLPGTPESPLGVTLVQAISRGERMDQSLQKATELGVCGIQPLVTERVEVRLRGARQDKRMAHWLAVVRSACEQSGRARIPELHPVATLADWLSLPVGHPRVALDPGAAKPLSALELRGGRLELLVGPEGGLSDAELRRLAAGGVTRVRMGPRVLRTETAGPAAIAVLQAIAGDF